MTKQTSQILVIVITFVEVANFLFSPTGHFLAHRVTNSAEEQEIIAALKRAYAVLDTPYDVVDLNQFDEVFIDHPIYRKELGRTVTATLRSEISKRLGVSSVPLAQVGYLTGIKSKRMRQQQGAKLLSQALQQAMAQGRTLTQHELDQLTAQNLGYEPTLPDKSLDNQRILENITVRRLGSRAWVTYDDWITGWIAILVKIKGQWLVAGIF